MSFLKSPVMGRKEPVMASYVKAMHGEGKLDVMKGELQKLPE